MSIQEVSAERLAELFHRYHQSLAEESGSTRLYTSKAWDEMPVQERWHIIAATRLALDELAARAGEGKKRYFAEPGKAEWGC